MLKNASVMLLLFVITTGLFAQKRAVQVSYAQEDVNVVLDGIFLGDNPSNIKVDFELSKSLIFFKRGFYTQRVEIEPETIIGKMNVDLVKKPKNALLDGKTLLKLDTLLISEIVTNMDEGDIWEIINSNFVKNNYYIGNSVALFPGATNEIQNTRFKLAIEVVSSNQVRNVYKSPRFMLGYMKIRWAVLDKTSNEVVYFEETEGSNFVRISKTKGMVVSDKMRIVMEGAIKEAQFKLLTDDKFRKVIQDK